MAEFIVNQEVRTDTATVEVTVATANPLALGRHTFRLVVEDDSGNRSIPDEVVVIIADQENPTAVLSAPRSVAFGRSFDLNGERSFDAGGGRITAYAWTYLGLGTNNG